MMRTSMLIAITLQICLLTLVQTAKQQVQLSDSYLPVAMQIIAHLTDQMAFETRDDVTPSPPRVTTTQTTTRPTTSTTTPKPYVTTSWPGFKPTTNGWWSHTSRRPEQTTPFHKPGLYAPFSPPKPFINRYDSRNFLLPMYNSEYTVLKPQEVRSDDPLLSIQEEEVMPLVEPSPNTQPLLPPHFDVKISSRSDGFVIDDISGESLQYLSEDVRDMIKMAKNPHDERVVDVWERSGPQPATTKAKLSASNLRLLLLYDLLSREAKRQRMSDYSGFSPDVMKNLVESSNGGAREQLKMALNKMVERKDCGHDYANNRAREMVVELGQDDSKLSSELRYLEPLVYKF